MSAFSQAVKENVSRSECLLDFSVKKAHLQQNQLYNVPQAYVEKRTDGVTRLKGNPLRRVREQRRQRHNGQRVDGEDDEGGRGGAVRGDADGHAHEQAVDVRAQDHVANLGGKGAGVAAVAHGITRAAAIRSAG